MKTTSIVIGRNDGYKDDKRCIIHLLSCLETFDEVIYVDWNTPADKYSLLWQLEDHLPKTGKLKHIIIPPSIAETTSPDPTSFKIQEPIARNIAIKRATGDWIVSTNIDIIPPSREEFNNFLKDKDVNTFYTISRREAPLEIVNKYEIKRWKELYKELVEKVEPRYFPAKVSPNDEYSLINCCGDFQLASAKVWNGIKGFEEDMYKFCFVDTNVQKKAILNGFKLKAEYDLPVFHIEHPPYKVNEKGEKIEAEEWNKNNIVDKYNDAYKFVEYFTESSNRDDWGFGNTEIEIEVI
tara:strand:- start:4170 stop:5054 length:885 start_codon:yes stop_codon:yes gene_type:complete